MNFDLTPDQVALREGIRSLLVGRFGSDRVRSGFDRAMFDELAGAGVFSLRADGFGWTDAAIVFEELGRAFVPGPLVWSLLAHGTVGGIVGGVEGATRVLVEHPDTIEALLVLDADGLACLDASDVTLSAVERPLDPLTPIARAATVPEGAGIGDAGVAAAWRHAGAVLTAAFLVGLATRAGELAVAHAATREQFGRVIGGFQAVKHLCADMAVRTEVARAATHAASVQLDDPGLGSPEDGRCAASAAKVLAGEAAVANSRASMQVHGGMGFTWEVDVHLLLKRAWVLDTHFGSVARHAWSIPGTAQL